MWVGSTKDLSQGDFKTDSFFTKPTNSFFRKARICIRHLLRKYLRVNAKFLIQTLSFNGPFLVNFDIIYYSEVIFKILSVFHLSFTVTAAYLFSKSCTVSALNVAIGDASLIHTWEISEIFRNSFSVEQMPQLLSVIKKRMTLCH